MKTTLPPLPPLPDTEDKFGKTKTSKFTYLFFMTLCLVGVGVYNSYNNNIFVEQSLDYKPVKRLDELNGKIKVTKTVPMAKPVRKVVVKKKSTKIHKLSKKLTLRKKINTKKAKKVAKKPDLRPLIQGELNLIPTTVFNPARGEQIKMGISGNLQMTEGIINSLNINLPTGESLEISSNREMSGNVFQYFDRNYDQEFSGMLYQISKRSYMVTLTNQPGYEGMRIQFDDPNMPAEFDRPTNTNSFRAKKPKMATLEDNGFNSQRVETRDSSYNRPVRNIDPSKFKNPFRGNASSESYYDEPVDNGYSPEPDVDRGYDNPELMEINDPDYGY